MKSTILRVRLRDLDLDGLCDDRELKRVSEGASAVSAGYGSGIGVNGEDWGWLPACV